MHVLGNVCLCCGCLQRMEHSVTVGAHQQQWEGKLSVGGRKQEKSLIVKHFGFRLSHRSLGTWQFITNVFMKLRVLKAWVYINDLLEERGGGWQKPSMPCGWDRLCLEKLCCFWAGTEPLCLEGLHKSSSCIQHRAVKNRDGNHFQRPHTCSQSRI